MLLTDGEDNVNEAAALDAAKNAAKAGLRIFTVGVGTTEGALIRVADADGNSDYIRDQSGNVVKTHLNELLLREIAGATGGFYLPLRGANTMDVLYERGLAPLPKSEGVGRMIRHYHEQFQWPLSVVILLLLAEMLLPERKKGQGQNSQPASYSFASTPAPAETPAAKPVQPPPIPAINVPPSTVALFIGLLLLFPMAAAASPDSALKDYYSGNYTNALDEYSSLAEVQTNDLRLVFNAGDAAYRMTNYDLAPESVLAR